MTVSRHGQALRATAQRHQTIHYACVLRVCKQQRLSTRYREIVGDELVTKAKGFKVDDIKNEAIRFAQEVKKANVNGKKTAIEPSEISRRVRSSTRWEMKVSS